MIQYWYSVLSISNNKIVLRSSALAGLPECFREAGQTGRECRNTRKSGKVGPKAVWMKQFVEIVFIKYKTEIVSIHYFAWIYSVLTECVDASFRHKLLFTYQSILIGVHEIASLSRSFWLSKGRKN
jgi:hypothetical protein